jgi:hypothetical protein
MRLHHFFPRYVLAAALAVAALGWTASSTAAQDCRWVGEGEALLCVEDDTGLATLGAWQGSGWTTVPFRAGARLPAEFGGLSSYGRSYPPSPVTPAVSYYSQNWSGNTLYQSRVLYGPFESAHRLNCTTQFWGGSIYRACR